MTEEEKEIISFFKTFCKSKIDYCKLEQGDVLDILNLIEKQQKEINRLKEIVKTYNAIPNDYMPNNVKVVIADRDYFNDGILKETCIPKSKIREKIKEYEELVNEFEEYRSKHPRQFKKNISIAYYKLKALQELLEE